MNEETSVNIKENKQQIHCSCVTGAIINQQLLGQHRNVLVISFFFFCFCAASKQTTTAQQLHPHPVYVSCSFKTKYHKETSNCNPNFLKK